MNILIRSVVVAASLSAGVLPGADDVVRVVGSSKLQLAIVDTARATPARKALHAAFAAGLGKAMTQAVGDKVEVQAKTLSADQAAFGLDSGSCQVVLALGNALPRPLVKSGMERLKAVLGPEKNEKLAYLVFSNADESLKKFLTASFSAAITDENFLNAFDGGIEADASPPPGKTLASTGP